ncbi:MAG: hypothetical protein QM534_09830 [Sediminibacterium sp.]|nr:hypothetical protein [Sediminibacterium sp.]
MLKPTAHTYMNGMLIEDINPHTLKRWKYILAALLSLGFILSTLAQTGGVGDVNVTATSIFEPTIKDAIKYTDLPEIKDSVKRLPDATYKISSKPLFPRYEVQPIEKAKMQNEPLPKIYHSLLKLGYGPIYNMPYGEVWLHSTRSRENAYGLHYKHFSSTAHLKDAGYGGFSDNEAELYAKQFYKKHTLFGDLNYKRNVVHLYGYDTMQHKLENDFTYQRYQLIEPKLRLVSHYTDSVHINHDIKLGYYNLQNINKEVENNIQLQANGYTYINNEKLFVNFLTDFYNHKQPNDTLNDLIVSLNPYFEAGGNRWMVNMGFTATLDRFKDKTRFYFYPQINASFNVYESLIIPYAGVSGGLIKNSFRKMSTENPFMNADLNYVNTNNKYNLFGGLRGQLSCNTSYDARVSYGQFDSLQFFIINYDRPNTLYNQFVPVYDNTRQLTVNGQVNYQLKEKIKFSVKGNYYYYDTKNLKRAYHKPDYDITLAGSYNLKNKIIVRSDVFLIGKQWALTQQQENGQNVLNPVQLNSLVDINLGAEYRYSKMLSFWAQFNNIAHQRYYRWERYPTQRFNFMMGLTFVPF